MNQPFSVSRRGTLRAFTILEILLSVLVIGVLLGLLIVGLNAAGVFVRNSADKQMVSALAAGVNNFRERFGFPPPLIKDPDPFAAGVTIVDTSNSSAHRIDVYLASNSDDRRDLRTSRISPTNQNFFADSRFSEFTISCYLAGAIESPLSTSLDLSIDGVPGPGFYKPRLDGTFEIPRDVIQRATGGNPATNRQGEKFSSLIDFSSSGSFRLDQRVPRSIPGGPPPTSLQPDPLLPRVVDKRSVPVRYYAWLSGRQLNPDRGQYPVETTADYNIPPLVGIVLPDPARNIPFSVSADRNPETNLALRSATWAIVAAGANGVFGDEDVRVLTQALSRPVPTSLGEEQKLRIEAAADNVVEVGK
jgi:type II secretory pathway pseudopilin PulG